MKIDGMLRASTRFHKNGELVNHLSENNIQKAILVPYYKTIAGENGIPVNNKSKPKKDKLLKYSKKRSKKISIEKVPKLIKKANKNVINIHAELSENTIPFYGVNINDKKALEKIEKSYNKHSFKGLHFSNVLNQADLVTPEIYKFFDWVEAQKLPMIIHFRNKTDVYCIQKIARDFKGINFIIQHLIGMELFEKCASQLSNIHMDISSLYAISDYRLRLAFKLFGPEKLLYGTGKPDIKCDTTNEWQIIDNILKDQTAFDLVTGGNWRTILNSH